MLKSMQGIETVTLTTNGVLLKRDIEALSEAGLDAVNISLDTLDAHQYKEMCGHDRLKEVLEGIHAALAQPGLKVKLNAVLMRETIDQIPKLAAMARDYPLSLRFIEMMPIGYGKGQELQSEMQVRSVLEEHFGPMLPNDKPHGNGPSHYFKLDGFQGDIGFISALSHKFCTSCNRVRLTADGFLKGCLQYKDGVSLRDLMRNGCTQEQLMHAIETCIYDKPAGHHFAQERPEDVTGEDEGRTMSQIGG